MLIIWLQGIWLPLHGYAFEDTPLWAGIFMLPLTLGFLIAGPVSGYLSDRFGARMFSTTGLVVVAVSFLGLLALPIDFDYGLFAALLLLNGLGQGMFSAPNTSSIMGSVPPEYRGVASGMRSTFQNSGTALSIGVFFSLMVSGLASSLPAALSSGLQAHGVPAGTAEHAASLPPVSTLFATFLGNNPVEHLLGSGGTLTHLTAAQHATLTGHTFFPQLVSGPFHHGLAIVFSVAAGMALVSALASALRGGPRPAQDNPPRSRPPTVAGPAPTEQRRNNAPS
jgi:MFS family permease